MKYYLFFFTFIYLFLMHTNESNANFSSVFSIDGVNVWAVGAAGNIFKSTDGGNSWNSFYVGNSDFNSIFIIGSNIWIAVQNGSIVNSTDGGNSWFTLTGFSPVKSIYFINASTGFFTGGGGAVYETTTGGGNWNPIPSGTNSDLNCIRFSNVSNGVVCGINGTVLFSSNGGSSWTPLSTPITKELYSIDMKDNTIIASGVDASVIKSTNMGVSWQVLDYKIITLSDINSIYMVDANTYYSIGGGGFIRKSTDGGQTFSFGINPMLATLNDVYFIGNKGWAVSKNTNAVIRTTDGGNNWLFPAGTTQDLHWELKVNSNHSPGNDFCLSPVNKREIFITASNNIYRTLDIGETWTQIASFNNGYSSNSFYISPKDTNHFITAIDSNYSTNGKILYSTNYGLSWMVTFSGRISSDGTPLTMDPNHTDTLYYAPMDTFLFKSTNFGFNWQPAGNRVFQDVCIMKVLEGNSNIILLGERESVNAYLFRSTDYAATWIKVDSGVGSGSEFPCVAYSHNNPSTIYCTYFFASGVKKSTNQGLTWSIVRADSTAWGIDIARDDPNLIVYGNGIGHDTYLSTNGGISFDPILSGISSENNAFLAYDRATIFAQQWLGYYKLRANYVVPIGIKKISSEIPKEFSLSQNYPNPFNPKTIINYQLAMNSRVKLVIYDVLGREVATLVKEKLQPGTYEVEWNATNFPSGVYFYKLSATGGAGDFTETKKMILIK
jgi:photosystem II stability/assembly factor-like uncharacterized protein